MTDSNSKNRRIKRRNSFIFFSRTLRILNCSGWKLDVKSFALVEQVWGYWRVWPGKWWFPVWPNRRLPSLWCGSYVYKATFRISLSIWIEIVVGCRSGLLSIVSCSFDPRPFSSQFASKCLLPFLSLSSRPSIIELSLHLTREYRFHRFFALHQSSSPPLLSFNSTEKVAIVNATFSLHFRKVSFILRWYLIRIRSIWRLI